MSDTLDECLYRAEQQRRRFLMELRRSGLHEEAHRREERRQGVLTSLAERGDVAMLQRLREAERRVTEREQTPPPTP